MSFSNPLINLIDLYNNEFRNYLISIISTLNLYQHFEYWNEILILQMYFK